MRNAYVWMQKLKKHNLLLLPFVAAAAAAFSFFLFLFLLSSLIFVPHDDEDILISFFPCDLHSSHIIQPNEESKQQ